MRYIAKIHVLDVMDEVVVSGYVYDADPLTDPDHEVTEFTFSVPGLGLSGPYVWLLNSLYRALVSEQHPAREGGSGVLVDGGTHTVTDVGQDV